MGTAALFAPGPERRNNLYPRGQRRACVGVHTRKSEKTSGESRHAATLSSIIPPKIRFMNRDPRNNRSRPPIIYRKKKKEKGNEQLFTRKYVIFNVSV